VALKPAVIACVGRQETVALQTATRTIPIVFFQVDDPVEEGLVAALARRGGNTTGLTQRPRLMTATDVRNRSRSPRFRDDASGRRSGRWALSSARFAEASITASSRPEPSRPWCHSREFALQRRVRS